MRTHISALRKSMFVSGLIAVISTIWWLVSAVSNVDTVIQHRGQIANAINLILSPRGTQSILALSIIVFVITVLAEKKREHGKPPETKSETEENETKKKIEAVNEQIISLNDEIASLKFQHAEEIEGRKRAFDRIKRERDLLKQQNDGLHAELAKQTWLYNIASMQAEQIDQYVKLDRIERGDFQLNDGVPFIKFGVWIVNHSLFDITLEIKSNSYIVFREQKLGYTLSVVSSNRISAVCRGEAHIGLVIEQRLSREEAFYISSSESRDDAIFYFDRLALTIKGDNREPQVEPKPLHINKGVTLHGESVTLSR